MKKSITILLFEAIIVGLSLVILALGLDALIVFPSLTGNPMIDGTFYTGMITHLFFEITGVNIWYSKHYCSLLKRI